MLINNNKRSCFRRFAKSFLYVLLGIGGSYFIFDIVLGSISFFEGEGTLTIISHCVYLVINSLWVCISSYIGHSIIISLQGIVISYIYCFNNIEIKSELWKKLNAKTNRFQSNSTKFISSSHYNIPLRWHPTNFLCRVSFSTPFFEEIISFFRDKSSCRIHSRSPLSLSLPRKENEVCPECVLKKKLLELNYFPHSETDTDDANTVCSTVVHSEQNTFHKVPQRVYPRVTNLSFCPEESDDILEDLNSP